MSTYNEKDSYWKPLASKPDGVDDHARKNPSDRVYSLSVCDRCGLAFGHALTYCPKCPGKMVKVDGMSYAEFVADRPGYHWGESSWRDDEYFRNRLARMESEGKSIPVVATTWQRCTFKADRENPDDGDSPVRWAALAARLVRNLKREDIAISELPGWPQYVEVTIQFGSFSSYLAWWSEIRGLRHRLDASPSCL